MSPWGELARRGMRSQRRSAGWWSLTIAAFTVLNVAFWPTLEGSDALQSLKEMSQTVLEAFGAQNIATPAGYLDGQLFALMLPLLLSAMAIAAVTAATAGSEDTGRSELLHALPVSRRTIWASQLLATLAVLVSVAALVAALVVAARPIFSLDEVPVGRIVTATFACALLAAFHAAVAFVVGAFGASRSSAVGIAIGVLVVGYLLDFVLPISDRLAGARRASPWWWAIGDQPVSHGVDVWRILLLIAVGVALFAAAMFAVERRDIRSA